MTIILSFDSFFNAQQNKALKLNQTLDYFCALFLIISAQITALRSALPACRSLCIWTRLVRNSTLGLTFSGQVTSWILMHLHSCIWQKWLALHSESAFDQFMHSLRIKPMLVQWEIWTKCMNAWMHTSKNGVLRCIMSFCPGRAEGGVPGHQCGVYRGGVRCSAAAAGHLGQHPR